MLHNGHTRITHSADERSDLLVRYACFSFYMLLSNVKADPNLHQRAMSNTSLDSLSCQLITALILFMPHMAPNPFPFNLMRFA